MLVVVCRVLFVVCCLWFRVFSIDCCLLVVGRWLLFDVCCLSVVVIRVWFVDCFVLWAVVCFFFVVVCCVLFVDSVDLCFVGC